MAGLGVVVVFGARVACAQEVAVFGAGQAPQAAVVRNLQLQDGVVSGMLVNESDHAVRDVALLIRYLWVWADERHPGRDNPGWAAAYTVFGDLPPGGRLPFTYRAVRPLPARADGHVMPHVEVTGFTQVGRASAQASR
jgi:hypothetical protein